MLKTLLRKLIPPAVLKWRQDQQLKRFASMSQEETFSTIYKENLWGGEKGEFCSGSGTTHENTRLYIEAVSDFIRQHDIKTLLDVGCGDFRIMKQIVEKTGVIFIGTDLVKDLIDYNNRTFGTDKITFLQHNAVTDDLPAADLVTIRQVLQHLNNESITIILNKLKPFRFALLTEHLYAGTEVVYNADKSTGPDIRLYRKSGVFFDKPPFALNPRTFLEYPEDMESSGRHFPAVMRTSLLENQLR